MIEFLAYLVDRDNQGKVHGSIKSVNRDSLPPGEVLIKAQWSSLNYKDALAATGHPGVVRRFPHIPGIDVAGVVEEVTGAGVDHWKPNDLVIVTGFDLGAGHWGGWSQYVRVPSQWVVKRPEHLTLRDAMVFGTAGFTAALSVAALLHHGIEPQSGEIVVTGATGGVGCIAVLLLAKLGFRVVAVTSKTAWHERLRQWGATEILPREAVVDSSGKPLLTGRWSGAVDTVGGNTLATILRQMRVGGCVAACGLVGGTELPLTVHPFILRGVTLAGIDSAWCSADKRRIIWSKLSDAWRIADLGRITTETDLQHVDPFVQRILAGEMAGRTVIRIP
jgi:acrylyl-CoA reductase (NADPH)